MKKNLLALILCLSVSFVSSIAMAAEYPKMVVRIASSTPSQTTNSIALEKLAEIITEKTDGAIQFKSFFSGVLGDEQAMIKQLQSNEVQMIVIAAGNLTPFAPQATIAILPYLFPKKSDAYKFFNNEPLMNEIADIISKQSNVRPIGWLASGYRVLTNSKRPINNINDMQGMKWRVPPVKLQLDAFRSWGVEPHPLPWIETFNGLQQGVVDGQENPHVLNRDTKFWEVQKYVTNIHYMLWVGPMLVSERWFRKLDDKTKQLFMDSAKEAIAYGWKWNEEQEAIAIEECKANGMIFNELSDENVWIEKARAVWVDYYDSIGGKEMMDKALATMK